MKYITLPLDISLGKAVRLYILAVLESKSGNRTQTAKSLVISLRSLRMRLSMWSFAGYPVTPYKKPTSVIR